MVGPVPILVCGLYRSGTHYLQELILHNFRNIEKPDKIIGNNSEPPYKHTQFKADMSFYEGIHVVLTYKNPWKWVDSICRQSYDLCQVYDVCLNQDETPIKIKATFPHNVAGYVDVGIEQLCDHYNRWMKFWKDEHTNWPFLSMRHDIWAFDNEFFIATVAKKFRLKARPVLIKPVQAFVSNSVDFTEKDLNTYLDLDYYEFLKSEHIDIIAERIDWDTYEWLESLLN
jgi:hypothetical protein